MRDGQVAGGEVRQRAVEPEVERSPAGAPAVDAADQTCDGGDGQPDVDATSLAIEALQGDGLVRWRGETLVVTDLGRYFVRNVAMTFDAYLDRPAPTVARAPTVRFSATV